MGGRIINTEEQQRQVDKCITRIHSKCRGMETSAPFLQGKLSFILQVTIKLTTPLKTSRSPGGKRWVCGEGGVDQILTL